ncbi:hypothetical protein GQ600_23827 [Phytophthora cactorum]|nr:hypothetical protein GQ600_23827 [Phytophthora cactorum]
MFYTTWRNTHQELEPGFNGLEAKDQAFTFGWDVDNHGKPGVCNGSNEKPYTVGLTRKVQMLLPPDKFFLHVDATYTMNIQSLRWSTRSSLSRGYENNSSQSSGRRSNAASCREGSQTCETWRGGSVKVEDDVLLSHGKTPDGVSLFFLGDDRAVTCTPNSYIDTRLVTRQLSSFRASPTVHAGLGRVDADGPLGLGNTLGHFRLW